jgi:hypothetical protein
MGDHLHNGSGSAARPQFVHGTGGEFGHRAIEEIPQFPVALFKAELVPVGRLMLGIKIECL